jgi:uncharacterized protein YndB with AHSA1/START domain
MSEVEELSITRHIKASPETVWRVLTERATEWFCPLPWRAPVVDYDLRPGGRANVEMRGPEGEEASYKGVVLEVEPGRRLVTTGAFTEGWVPQAGEMNFVRIDTLEPEDGGTRYTTRARHWDQAAVEQHKAMGFEAGWGAVADQLAALAEQEERT